MNWLEIDIEIYMSMYYHMYMYCSVFNEDSNDFILNLFQELPITYSTCLQTFNVLVDIISYAKKYISSYISVCQSI